MSKKVYSPIIIFFCFICFAITSLANTLYEGALGNNLKYELNDENQLVLSGSGNMVDFPNGITEDIPWRHWRSNIHSITISEGIESIGDFAFVSCANLTSIEIPQTVTTIGRRVFISCESLPEITIPNQISVIRDSVFMGCTALGEISLPNTIKTIEENAFCDCPSLSTIYFHGTSEEWNTINIAAGNDDLLHARIICLMDEDVRDKTYAYTTDKSSISRAYDFDTKTLTVGATVTSRTDAGAVKVIVAVYNADGRLMQTAIKDTFFDKNETKQLEIPLEGVEYPFDKVAVFVWDYTEMMKPMALGKDV